MKLRMLFIGLWLVLAFMGCGLKRIKGNGDIVTEERTIRAFHSIKSAGDFHVFIQQAPEHRVRISTDRNIIDYIETEVQDGELVIKVERGKFIYPTGPVKVYVTTPSVVALTIAGSGKMIAREKIHSRTPLEVKIAGAGDIELWQCNAPAVNGKIAGSGKIKLEGETKEASYEIAGSGDLRCGNLKAETTRIKIAGSGDAWVYASILLEATVAGSGDIYYYGTPASVKSKIAGSGKLIKE